MESCNYDIYMPEHSHSVAQSRSPLRNSQPLPTRRDTIHIHGRKDSVCSRLIRLFEYDFRVDIWYLNDLYLLMIAITGAASGTLTFAFSNKIVNSISGFTSLKNVLCVVPLLGIMIGLIALSPIPWCWIIDSLDPTPLSQRHFLSIARLAIDPGKGYQGARLIFFLCFLALFSVCGSQILTSDSWPLELIPFCLWCMISLLFNCAAFFMCVHSISWHVLS